MILTSASMLTAITGLGLVVISGAIFNFPISVEIFRIGLGLQLFALTLLVARVR